MLIYSDKNVFEMALARIEYIYSEFDDVIISISGGKDSTIILNLALLVAERLGKLPLKALFIDQEAEWQHVIDYLKRIKSDPRIELFWLQCPLRISNGTSYHTPWLYCWEDGKEWMREKEADSIHQNIYGTLTFKHLFDAFQQKHYPNTKLANLGGVRAEESPTRRVTLCNTAKYKWVTWGKKTAENHFTFYPIYDWSYTDVWKAIYDNSWDYCQIYDYFYRYGVPLQDMRVSSLHHETAVRSLFYLQEIEPNTWNKLTARLEGISTADKIGREIYFSHSNMGGTNTLELPFMFRDWREYRDYLLENLIPNEELKALYRKRFDHDDLLYADIANPPLLFQRQVRTLMLNDYHFTKLDNFNSSPESRVFRKFKKQGFIPQEDAKYARYIKSNQLIIK